MFESYLKEGKIGESQIANWFKSKGYNILPVYEVEKNQYAGPAIFTSTGKNLIAPDMLIFGKNKPIYWIEAKHKSAFSWHRITHHFVTGIDLYCYQQYQEIMKLVNWPIWLLFLHKPGKAKNSPAGPSGLFGNSLDYLVQHENHRSKNWGRSGMVYWAVEHLKKLACYPLLNHQQPYR